MDLGNNKLALKLAEDLNAHLGSPETKWVQDPYGRQAMSLSPVPEIPSANGLPMRLVARTIVALFDAYGIRGVTVRPRDCIAGDGEPVVDIMVPYSAYREKIASGTFARFEQELVGAIAL